MITDSCDGRSVRAYLTKPEILTEEFINEMVLSTEYSRGLISLKGDRDIIVSTETGKTLFETDRGFTLGGYDTANGTIVMQLYNGGGRLLYIEKEEIKEYVYDGDEAHIINGLVDDGEPQAVGVIVETKIGLKLLNEKLCPLSADAFSEATVHTGIIAGNRNNEKVFFPLKDQWLSV